MTTSGRICSRAALSGGLHFSKDRLPRLYQPIGRVDMRTPADLKFGAQWTLTEVCCGTVGECGVRSFYAIRMPAIMRFKQSLHAFQSKTLIHSPHLTQQRASTRLETAEGDLVKPTNTLNHQFTGFLAAQGSYHARLSCSKQHHGNVIPTQKRLATEIFRLTCGMI